jgi:hypothetical protein
MDKREIGTVEFSVVAGDVRAVLRGIKRVVLRLLVFSGGVCFGLARHGLPRHWASRGMVFRGRESCETWSLPRHCLERHGVLRDLEEKSICLGWSSMVVRRSGIPVDISQSHPSVSNSVLQIFFSSSSCDCARLTMMTVRYC